MLYHENAIDLYEIVMTELLEEKLGRDDTEKPVDKSAK